MEGEEKDVRRREIFIYIILDRINLVPRARVEDRIDWNLRERTRSVTVRTHDLVLGIYLLHFYEL